uniref:Uncharacterized protein n=1 Tax=Trichogramma kaykai TaxID=54128 RepID=A0ABD2X405_9HYME
MGTRGFVSRETLSAGITRDSVLRCGLLHVPRIIRTPIRACGVDPPPPPPALASRQVHYYRHFSRLCRPRRRWWPP